MYAARLHAGEFGAETAVLPSKVSFRLKPEQVEFLADFVNRPELTQTVASNQGASEWICELSLTPEQLTRKYHSIVPDHLRICRTEVLDYLRQKCFRLQRAKSCLCGPCEEHGWQNFEDLIEIIRNLGLGADATAGFIAQVKKLQEYLKHEYRRLCTNSLQVGCQGSATLCIRYALCGEGEFSCSCKETEHAMNFEQCNERFYLIADLRDVVRGLHRSLQAQLDAIRPNGDDGDDADAADADRPLTADAASNETLADKLDDALAELDEREEELVLCESHLDFLHAPPLTQGSLFHDYH